MIFEQLDCKPNFSYNAAGNQTRGLDKDGATWLRFEYDAANRLQAVKKESDGSYVQAFQFGSTNARLMDTRGGRTPSGIPSTVSGGGDFGVMNKIDYLDGGGTMHPAAPYGIIKFGPNDGDVTVYDKKGVISPKDYGKSIGCF